MERQIVVAALFLAAWSAGAQTNSGQIDIDNSTYAKRPSVVLPELQLRGPVSTTFTTLVREAGLSGGVATLNDGCSQGQEVAISLPAGTSFDKALAQVAAIKPKSEWQRRDGVANLFAAGGVPPLLKLRIHSFEWDRNAPIKEVIDRLRQLPEVSEEAIKLGLREAPIGGGTSAICLRGDCSQKPRPATEPETEQDVSLLTLLNRIVQAHSHAVWDYSEYHCDGGALFSLSALAE